MKAVNKVDADQLKEVIEGLREAGDSMEVLRDEIIDNIARLNEEISKYNNMLKNANDVRGSIMADIEEYMEGQTDDWRSGSEGEIYTGWHDLWDGLDLEPIDKVDEPDVEEIEHAHALEEVPLSVE